MKDEKFGFRVTILIVFLVIIAGVFIMKKNTNIDTSTNETLSLPQDLKKPQVLTELIAEDIVLGTGAEATQGATISVHYTGTLLNGTKFDSSLDRGTPFSFTLGVGSVIPGWDQGVAGMKVGGIRKLIIPASLAYGDQAQGPIPPDSPLAFEIELLSVE